MAPSLSLSLSRYIYIYILCLKEARWLSSLIFVSAIRVQNLTEVVFFSLRANASGKSKNSFLFP